MKIIRVLEHLSCQDRLRELRMFILEKKRLQGNLRAAFQYLKAGHKKVRDGLFKRVYSDKTRKNGFKMKNEGGPELNIAINMGPHQYQTQRDNHCPGPPGHSISETDQDAISLLGHLGTLLAQVQLDVKK
ncbi:hypothetical protein BTVI_42808 [Pitangus sulphuratus]|nr:hypothetical protein BTVI_42808 [Pitangus sulphuratus]